MRFRRLWKFLAINLIVFTFEGAICSPVFAQAPVPVQTNDTFLPRQWYLDSIKARIGWNMATGSRDVIVAVIDSGVDIDHPDIKNNLWTNTAEIPGNGKDDDQDGYIDDVHGWNFVTGSANVRPQSSVSGIEEAYLHGTAVASMIAGEGNNDIGISGVAWHARIMSLPVLDSDGYGRDDALVGAIRYAVAHGADIINFSLVGYESDPQLAQAIKEATAQGVLVVSAAGNSDAPGGTDLDKTPAYPACDRGIGSLGVLTVTALDRQNRKADRANYGSCVDVAAPGSSIFAARPTHDVRDFVKFAPGYTDNLSGTSVAAPLVSGLAVLLKAEHPTWRGPEIAARILATTDSVDEANPSFRGKLGHGKINVERALRLDDTSDQLGPLQLEASGKGGSPEVRVLTASGKEMFRFAVGDPGDKRGVRAAFVRWQKGLRPDIAVTMAGDPTGAWRIYRPDGLLVAAGTLGTDVSGGVYVSAVDVNATGQDVLFLGEASGTRAWFTSAAMPPQKIVPFPNSTVHGIVGVDITRPVSSFLLLSVSGDPMVSVVGRDGLSQSMTKLDQRALSGVRSVSRFARSGDGDAFRFQAGTSTLTFVSTASGLDETMTPRTVGALMQVPMGKRQSDGWMFYEVWPR